jgi:hypothetical protein
MIKALIPIFPAFACFVALGAGAISGCSSTTGGEARDSGISSETGPGIDSGTGSEAEAGPAESDAGGASVIPATGDENTPPTGSNAAIEAWISKGDYKKGLWRCDPAPHPPAATGSSPHGQVLICSNDKAQAFSSGSFAVGAATVKELYSANGKTLNGTAISLKVKSGPAEDTWYWYERIGKNDIANGINAGVCVGCHSRAGTAGNTGGDYTFSVIK